METVGVGNWWTALFGMCRECPAHGTYPELSEESLLLRGFRKNSKRKNKDSVESLVIKWEKCLHSDPEDRNNKKTE